MKHRTLQSRIGLHFFAYALLLVLVYSVALVFVVKQVQDAAMGRQLSSYAADIVTYAEAQGRLPEDLPPHVTVFIGLSAVPSNLQPFLRGRQSGSLEINDDGLDFHATVRRVRTIDRPVYILYDVSSIELTETYERYLLLGFAGIGVGILILGVAVARSMSRRLATPLAGLAAEVQDLSFENAPPSLQQYDAPDEIGTLARTIRDLFERVSAFTRREREFTSHASHELRTPATVIKGAAEILQARRGDDIGIGEPTARIQRAVREIETLIDTFLLLAREDEPPTDQVCELRQITEAVVAAHRHLLDGKPVEVNVQASQAGTAHAAPAVASIALGNLVRNAFMYTAKGQITLQALGDRVVVTNPVCEHGITKGEGLGLTIVRRLCERMGWRLEVSHPAGTTMRAELIFSLPPASNPLEDISTPEA